MRKRFWITRTVLLLVTVAGLSWLIFGPPREPVYDGKPLTTWLHGYDRGNWKRKRETDDAVRHIGTNAFPLLLKLLRENESSLKFRTLQLLARQPFIKIPYTPAQNLNGEAMWAFNALGPGASGAVSGLIQVYRAKISPDSQWATANALGNIGPAASNAVPALLEIGCTTNKLNPTNFIARQSAICALGKIHAQPGTVVPALMDLLPRHTAAEHEIAVALGEYGPAAKPALPLLIKAYDHEGVTLWKADIAEAIKKTDPTVDLEGWWKRVPLDGLKPSRSH